MRQINGFIAIKKKLFIKKIESTYGLRSEMVSQGYVNISKEEVVKY